MVRAAGKSTPERRAPPSAVPTKLPHPKADLDLESGAGTPKDAHIVRKPLLTL